MNKRYSTPFGDFKLNRIPDNDKNLQAWNSADSYLLNHLSELVQEGQVNLETANILIMNDDFGALTVPMAQFSCDSLSDSYISHDAMRKNIHNNCPQALDKVSFIKSTAELDKNYDVVLFKYIKSQTYLKEQMLRLAGHISSNTLILGASMAKNLQKSTLQMLSKVIGDTKASLTWKKARLIHIKPEPKTGTLPNNIATYHLEPGNEAIHGLANVFSRNKLDIGTRFFLKHFPDKIHPQPEIIIDLGCGNGVLALKAAQNYPDAIINCIDESYMAVESAKLTIEANLKAVEHKIKYQAANALDGIPHNSAGLILCNPPFHQQYVVGDAIAWQMFRQSKDVLRKGGEIWIVGNRHLGYHLKLKKIFGNHKLIASNDKFVILSAVKN